MNELNSYLVAGFVEGEGDLSPVEVDAMNPAAAAFLMGIAYAMSWYDSLGFLTEDQGDFLARVRDAVTITVD